MRGAIALLALALSACTVGPDYQRPDMALDNDWHVDLEYKVDSEESLADQDWVEIFQNEQLQNLVQQALQENRALLIAMERIAEASARYRIERAPLFPSVGLGATGERERESGLTSSAPVLENEFFFGPVFGWELDLWGGNRRASASAYASYLASEYGAQAVRLSVIAEVCRAYFELQGINARLDTNYNTLGAREESLTIAQKRFTGGLTSELQVKQAEVELATSRAAIPRVEQSKLVAENQLAVLLGLPPQHLALTGSLEEQRLPASVTAGIPSELLRRRPDIMQAEQALIAASEAVGVATARLFPSIGLTGALGYQTTDFDDLLDSDGKYWILELDIVMPLFNAGARRAEVSVAEARFNRARLAYEQATLEALREVSNALNQFHKAGETLRAELALEQAASEYLRLASQRFRNGVLSYLDVLDAQRQLFDAQIEVSNARQAQLFALVDLYKALGGGWDPASIAAAR